MASDRQPDGTAQLVTLFTKNVKSSEHETDIKFKLAL